MPQESPQVPNDNHDEIESASLRHSVLTMNEKLMDPDTKAQSRVDEEIVSYEQAAILNKSRLYLLGLVYITLIAFVGVAVTLIRSQGYTRSKRFGFCLRRIGLIFGQSLFLNLLDWKLERNIATSRTTFPIGDLSSGNRAIALYILRDPVLSFGYIAIIIGTSWVAIFSPLDFFNSDYFFIVCGLFFLLHIFIDRFIGNKRVNYPKSSQEVSNNENGKGNNFSWEELEERFAGLENLELLFENGSEKRRNEVSEIVGVDFESVIKESALKVHQRMKYYKTFQFVFPITCIIIQGVRTYRVIRNNKGAVVEYSFALNEVLISVSFFTIGQLNKKSMQIMLTKCMVEHLPNMRDNTTCRMEAMKRIKTLCFGYNLTIAWIIMLAFKVSETNSECVVGLFLVLVLIFVTNKATTGSYFALKNKAKAMRNKV